MDNNNNLNINNNNKNILNNKEAQENENIYQEILNRLNKTEFSNSFTDNSNKKEEKNFSQQVDFLYHKDNPEGQSSIKNILIKQYKKQKKIQSENIKNKKRNKSLSPKKKIIPYGNKNKGLFDPYLSQKELDYESNIEKQRAERQKKIDDYEKNLNRKKLVKDLNKKILNFSKPNINSTKNNKINIQKRKNKKQKEELITHFIQVPKPKIKKNLANNFGFFPKKYDMIINSLISEINQGKKENLVFEQKMKNYGKKNIDRYNNYYEYIYNNQNKDIQQKKNNLNNKNNKVNRNNKPTRAEIIKGLMQKYFGKENNKQIKSKEIHKNNNESYEKNKNKINIIKSNNNINNNLILDLEQNDNNEEINFDNIDKLLSSEKINFQDKINIISELNKNIDKYSNAMPLIINEVQDSLDKIYKNNKNDIYFRKEANKVPYIAMASKAAYQIIQTNMDAIIETILKELLFELALDFKEINQKKETIIKKRELINEFDLVNNNLNEIIGQEKNILEENIKFIEDKRNNINEINNKNSKENKIIIKKYKANIDESIIEQSEKYKNEFKKYMVFKGSFYADNIFDVYDEYIEEEANSLLDKMVNQFIENLNIN